MRVLVFMATAVTTGWFLTFVIFPAVRGADYRAAPETATLMGTVFTGLAGSLAVAAYKARKPRDDTHEDDSNTDGDHRDVDD